MKHYKLVDRKPVEVADLLEWAGWFETAERHVAKDEIGEVLVSTVFLGLDHAHKPGKPILFETMIFGGKHDEYQARYSTWEEAERGHKKALALIVEKCHGCGGESASESHECPFASEIHGDESLCNCCDACAHECAMDI